MMMKAAAKTKEKAKTAKQKKAGGGDGSPAYNFRIRDSPAFSQLEVSLRPGESIVANGGSLSYVREGVSLGKLEKAGSFFDMVKRAFADQALFFDKYEGLPDFDEAARTVAFASHYPGDMMAVKLAVGQRMVVSRDAYLAGSPNVKVTGKFNLRGLFVFGQDEGFMLPELVCEPPEAADNGPTGFVFIASYGSFQKHTLAEGQSLLVNNGLFLACIRDNFHDERALYTVETLGRTFLSTVLGGEGLGMRFEGPCDVYTQSRSFDDFVGLVAARLPPPPPSASFHTSSSDNNWFGGGTNKKKKKIVPSKKTTGSGK
jgi:uncharacterized protein (TIGR00266 family)